MVLTRSLVREALLGQDDLRWQRSNPYFMTGDDETRWKAWIAEDRAALEAPLAGQTT